MRHYTAGNIRSHLWNRVSDVKFPAQREPVCSTNYPFILKNIKKYILSIVVDELIFCVRIF